MRPYAFVFSSGACSAAGVRHADRKVHSAPQRPPRHPSQFIFPASFDLVAAAVVTVVLIVSAACRFHSRAKWERSKALFAGQDKDAKQYHLPRLRARYINIRQPTGESLYHYPGGPNRTNTADKERKGEPPRRGETKSTMSQNRSISRPAR